MNALRPAVIACVALVAAMTTPTAAVSQASTNPGSFVPLDSLSAAAGLTRPITLYLAGVPLRSAVSELATQAGISIVFDPTLNGLDRTVSIRADAVPAARCLLRLLDGTSIQAMVSPGGAIVLVAHPRADEPRPMVGGQVSNGTRPLWGVRLNLVGTRFETSSDPSGRFSLGAVPPGEYTLRAIRLGYAPVTRPLSVSGSSDVSSLDVTMTPAAVPVDAVIVTPGYYGVLQPMIASAQTLTRSQIETVPQLGEDVYRAIARLPGVAATDFSAKFNVRGESGDGLAVTLDGLPLTEPFHLKDLGNALSIVDLVTLGGAELITGGPSAEHGELLAGVFSMHTVDPHSDRARTSAGLSLTNLRGMTQGGFAQGKGGYLVSARRGYLDLAFKLAHVSDSLYPSYNDLFAKVTYDLPRGERLAVHALHAGDRLRFLGANDPSLNSRYTSDFAWATLDGRVGSSLRQETVAWFGSLDWLRTGERARSTQLPVSIHDARGLHDLGVRQSWSAEMGSRALFKVGGELRRQQARYDYRSLAERVVVDNHAETVRTDSASAQLDPAVDRVGLYVSQRVRPVDALTLEAGARYDRASHTGEAIVSPRGNVALQAAAGTTIRGSWGEYAQSQSVFDLQVQDGVRAFAPAERARQAVLGVEQLAGSGMSVRVEGYARDLSSIRPRYVNGTMAIPPFPEIAYDRVLLAPSRARARGIEASVERAGGPRMDWSANYVLASSTQEVNGAWIPRAGDERSSVHADWSLHPESNAWRLSVSGVWHTGWPYTPEAVRIDTVFTGGAPKFAYVSFLAGPYFTERVPAYQRVDARWTRFIDTRSGRVTLFVDVYNLLNTTNLRDRYTNVNVNGLRVVQFQGNREQLPRLPSFGFSWEF